jgi:hypothetical protein
MWNWPRLELPCSTFATKDRTTINGVGQIYKKKEFLAD